MTTQPELVTELDSTVVTVYHGTRRSLGAAILRGGFCSAPVADQIAAAAQNYGVPLKAIHDHLVENVSTEIPGPLSLRVR